MAPRGRRGGDTDAQPVYELGRRGRKTGVSLQNTGQVDEHGFQPLETLFSSPQKAPASTNGDGGDDHSEEEEEEEEEEERVQGNEPSSDSGSEAMDIPSSAGPGPQTILRQRDRESRLPRSRSPIKTTLMSPARRNPALGSSPSGRVTRRLDFSGRGNAARTNGATRAAKEVEEEEEEEDEEEDDVSEADVDDGPELVDDGAADDADDSQAEAQEESEMGVPSPPPPPPSGKRRGRPPKKDKQAATTASQPARGPRKRLSRGDDTQQQPEDEQAPEPKRQRTAKQPAKKPTKAPPKLTSNPPRPRGRPGRKPKQATAPSGDDDVGETSFAALQKGPPMPRRPGLVSVRRDPDEVRQTRSGRHSYKPLNWWAGEQVITEEEERSDIFTNDRGFVLNSVKEIVRVHEEEPSTRKAMRGRGRPKGAVKTKKRAAAREVEDMDEAEEPEEWETGEGLVVSEVIAWEPEYETHPPGDDDQVHISEERIAVSADAVQTKEIHDATFRFAKTLTMPFMGAGVVDLPPGSEKRPKNSRKMHMVFFVHYGKVAVTVNEGQFRISAGGQWFVPRGNYYSISNDYQSPARIFFAQACEVTAQQPDASESMLLAPGS